MKGNLGLGRSTGICTTGQGDGNSSVPAASGAVGDRRHTRPAGGSGFLLLRTLALVALLTWVSVRVEAGRPLAENIVFGSVWKADRAEMGTNLVIEARRGDVGPVVARCRIGEDPGAGELFFLHIQRESAPALSPVAVDAEDVLTLVATSSGQPTFRTRVKMPAPGRCLRIDFGRNGREVAVTEVDRAPVHVRRPALVRPSSGAERDLESSRRMELATSVMRVVERRPAKR
jgi:hypothetical protein